MTTTILRGLVGSHAYGLATETSDRDYLAVHQAPTADVLGLHGAKITERTVVSHGPDCQSHELAKFCRLALAGNPTIMELLWLPMDHYDVLTDAGRALLVNRRAFLSNRVRATYGGYARQQAHKIVQRGGAFSSDLAKRTGKHGRHCARLLLQGGHLLRTGEVLIRLDGEQALWCREMGELAITLPGEFEERMADAFAKFDSMSSALPDEPDRETVERLVVHLRRESLREEMG